MKPTLIHSNVPVGRWAACLLLALAVSSCTHHDETSTPAPTALQVGSASMSGGLSTYADEADRTLNASADQMGIFLQEQSGNYRAVNNRLFAYATPFWQTDEQLLLTATDAQLTAYYPYNTAHEQNPILMRSGIYTAASDLSYTPFVASSSTSYVNLTLGHAYARLKFNFTPHAHYESPGAITHMSVAGQGIRSMAHLDLFKANGTAGSIINMPSILPSVEIPLSDMNIAFAGTPLVAQTDFLFIPGTLSGNITFTATIDGRKMQGTVTATALCGAGDALQCGLVYQVNVTVLPLDLLVIDGVTITEWEEEPVNNGGDYVPTPGDGPLAFSFKVI